MNQKETSIESDIQVSFPFCFVSRVFRIPNQLPDGQLAQRKCVGKLPAFPLSMFLKTEWLAAVGTSGLLPQETTSQFTPYQSVSVYLVTSLTDIYNV